MISGNLPSPPPGPEPGAGLPAWTRPRSSAQGQRALLVAGACVLAVALIYLVDLMSPGISFAAAFILPVLAAAWLLSDRLAALVIGITILFRTAAWIGGVSPALEVVTDIVTLCFVAGLGRVAAVYVEATREAASRAALIARIAKIATSAGSIATILDRILQEMAGEGLRGGLIALINEQNEIYPVAAEGDIDASVWNSRIQVGSGIMGTAAAEGRSIVVSDIDAPDLPTAPVNRSLGSNVRIKSLVVVPLLAAGRVIGVLELDSSRPGRFGPAELALLEQIALAVSDAVQREGALQLADELVKRRVEELTLLLEAARTLSSSLDADVVQAALVSLVERAVSAEGGQAALIRIDDGRLISISDRHAEEGRIRPLDFPLAFAPAEMLRAIESGHAVGCSRENIDPALARAIEPGAKSFAWAPVRVGGQLYGVVSATSDRDLFEWPALRMLEGVADLAGLAIGNAERLRLELARASELQAHADRMAELEKVKADFLKVASHELRGPLAVLKGYISMLADGSISLTAASTGRIFDVIASKLQEVSDLVEQMLDTARLEDSRLQLSLDRQDLVALTAHAAERVRPVAGDKHRIVLTARAESIPVIADRSRLLTILTNLLDNAVKYSPAGGEIEVRTSARGERAEVRVRDRGLGIAPADLPRLFTRFGRIVTAENSHIPGTGLGLYLARELARMHGGDVTVRSEQGAGSTFTLTLPLAGARVDDSVMSGAGSD